MKTSLTEKQKDEALELFYDYVNNAGLWNEFREFIEEKGYKEEEFFEE